MSNLYHVRQYRPNFFSGFDNAVIHNVTKDEILSAPWFRNFEHEGFAQFTVELYGNGELIISAKYKNGESWVAGFAVSTDSEMANNWRYKNGIGQ